MVKEYRVRPVQQKKQIRSHFRLRTNVLEREQNVAISGGGPLVVEQRKQSRHLVVNYLF